MGQGSRGARRLGDREPHAAAPGAPVWKRYQMLPGFLYSAAQNQVTLKGPLMALTHGHAAGRQRPDHRPFRRTPMDWRATPPGPGGCDPESCPAEQERNAPPDVESATRCCSGW
ncbi:hypothetical protein GCM10008937_13170 [Deinococcus depolymerans]|uniref:Uncharacterized protein n=1 Tax=Deinococcus depolymerans TaxID=392408 RepID=A0ABN1BVT5_9DEIO